MRQMWTKLWDFAKTPSKFSFFILCVLLVAISVLLWWEEITLVPPGPAIVTAGLAAIFVFLMGLAFWLEIKDLNQEGDNLVSNRAQAQKREALLAENKTLIEERDELRDQINELTHQIENLQDKARYLGNLPDIIGFEKIVERWLEFKNLNGAKMYDQLVIAQRLFNQESINSVTIIKSFDNVKPERSVFLVQPLTKDRQVLKFDIVKNIKKELNSFENCVRERGGRHAPGRYLKCWPPEPEIRREPDESLGAIVYELAQLGNNDPQTLAWYYRKRDINEVTKILQEILTKLHNSWWGREIRQGEPDQCWKQTNGRQQPLNIEYKQLINKLSIMTEELESTLLRIKVAPRFDIDQKYFSLEKPIVLPDNLRNPLHWVKEVFANLNAFQTTIGYLENNRRDSIVHGDFHAGNILVEEHTRQPIIWFIDFSHTHIGPTVQDIARLEADLKYGLFQEELLAPYFSTIFAFENAILGNSARRSLDLLDGMLNEAVHERDEEQFLSHLDLERAWEKWCDAKHIELSDNEINLELSKLWQSLALLRQRVRYNYLLGNDARPYYLALLHATLPELYYSDRSPWQKLYAYISAALLCERLGG